MDFEWNEVKNRRNLAKHGVSFEEGARVFATRMVREVDDRRAYGETAERADRLGTSRPVDRRGIEAAIRDDPDAAPIADEQWFEKAQLVIPAHLKHLWVQVDADLMAWFRQQGEDWPARINPALREHVEGRRKKRERIG